MHYMTAEEFKDFLAAIFTLIVSLIFVPVAFIFFAVAEWNFIVPIFQAMNASDRYLRGHSDFGKHYMYYMIFPFIGCISGVRYAYQNIRDALG